jgi:hypothetical protein
MRALFARDCNFAVGGQPTATLPDDLLTKMVEEPAALRC